MSEGRSKKVYEFSFSLQTKQKLLGSINQRDLSL